MPEVLSAFAPASPALIFCSASIPVRFGMVISIKPVYRGSGRPVDADWRQRDWTKRRNRKINFLAVFVPIPGAFEIVFSSSDSTANLKLSTEIADSRG